MAGALLPGGLPWELGWAVLLPTSWAQLAALCLLSLMLIYLEGPAGKVFPSPGTPGWCEGRTWAGLSCWWSWVSNPGRETRDQLGLSALILSRGHLK